MALERSYNIPLRKEFMKVPRYKRAKKAATALKEFLLKHMKGEDVKIGKNLNMEIWKRGIRNPPHHIKVNAVKGDDNIIKAELLGKKYEEKTKEERDAEKKQKKKAEKKSEPKQDEARSSAIPAEQKSGIGEVKKEEKPKEKKKQAGEAKPKPEENGETKAEKEKTEVKKEEKSKK